MVNFKPGYRIKMPVYPKYPKLDEQAKRIAQDTLKAINHAASTTEDEGMPYKAQYVLEEVIKILKERV
jgi:hypothetical protein